MATFTHAGVSKLNGKFRVRYANSGEDRQKILIRNGHTDIDMIELLHPMSKEDAVRCLKTINFAGSNAEVAEAIEREAKRLKISTDVDIAVSVVSEETENTELGVAM